MKAILQKKNEREKNLMMLVLISILNICCSITNVENEGLQQLKNELSVEDAKIAILNDTVRLSWKNEDGVLYSIERSENESNYTTIVENINNGLFSDGKKIKYNTVYKYNIIGKKDSLSYRTSNPLSVSFDSSLLNTNISFQKILMEKNEYKDILYVDNTCDTCFQEIQHAVDSVKPGQKIFVKSGIFKERVHIKKSGESGKSIYLKADSNVSVDGFIILGSHIIIDGFNIVGTTSKGWRSEGVWVKGDHIHIINNSILNFVNTAAINVERKSTTEGSENISILSNRISNVNKGMIVFGKNVEIRNNEIYRLYRGEEGGDADYFRFFGENIIIESNYLHGTKKSEIGSSHVDCFQTYQSNNSFGKNIMISNNRCHDYFDQGLMLSGDGSSHDNIIIINNEFHLETDSTNAYGICAMGVKNVKVFSNKIRNFNHGVAFRKNKNGIESSGIVKDNYFYNVQSAHWCENNEYQYIANNNTLEYCKTNPVSNQITYFQYKYENIKK